MDGNDLKKRRVMILACVLYSMLGFSALLLALFPAIERYPGERESEVILSLAFFMISVLVLVPIELVLAIRRQFWRAEWRLLALFCLTLILAVPLWLSVTPIFPHEYVSGWYTQNVLNFGLGLYGFGVAVLITWQIVAAIRRQ